MSRKGVFKLCTTVALVLALSLTICAFFSIWSFTKHDAVDTGKLAQLVPAYENFDNNRDAQAIMNIRQHQNTIGSIAGETQPCSGFPMTAADDAAISPILPTVTTGADWATAFGTPARSSFVQVTKLTSWTGTGAGCLVGGTVKAGTCPSTGVTGTPIDALAAMDLNRWRSDSTNAAAVKYYVFCTLSTISNVFVGVDTLSACPATDTLGNTQTQCGDHCYTTPKGYKAAVCPYSLWTLNDTSGAALTPVVPALPVAPWSQSSDGDTWITAGTTPLKMKIFGQRLAVGDKRADNADAIAIDVSWYGAPCENPSNAWVAPSQNYPLMLNSGTGCSLGADQSASIADSQDELAFLNDNADLFTNSAVKVLALPKLVDTFKGTQTFTVFLNNRRRILVQGTQSCDAFRFNANNQASDMLTGYNNIWDLVRYLAIVSASTAVLSVMMVLLIILEGYGKQNQRFMSILYTVCLVGLFCSVVMIWKARYSINGSYATAHQVFTDSKSCINDPGWSQVLADWITHTSFGDLGNQLVYTLGLFVVMLVIAVVFAIWALMQLASTADRHH